MDIQEHIRVLIADDSFFIRRYLVELLQEDPEIKIVGTASTGDEVVALSGVLHPDVITMDYHMPGKNGIEAAASIMLGAKPLPSIIMLSAFDGESGEEMRRALLSSGAEVITKPSGEVSLDIEKIAAHIIERIKICGRTQVSVRKALARIHHDRTDRVSHAYGKLPSRVVVIGASTGGPPLVEHLLSLLDPDTGLTIVVVQHMSKYFTELFAERLNRVTSFPTQEMKEKSTLPPGTATVVPGAAALALIDDEQADPEHTPHFLVADSEKINHEDTIDKTMTTVASVFGKRSIGVLLSGMGTDGAEGLKEIRAQGGVTLVQDPGSAAVSSMPLHAISEGHIDKILSIEAIAEYINAAATESAHLGAHDTMSSDGGVDK